MPKKSWASEEQQTWLLAQLSDFRQAQEAKTTPAFFTELYQNYHEQWPPASPNAGDSFTIIYLVVLIQYMHASDSMSTFIIKAGDQPQGQEPERL